MINEVSALNRPKRIARILTAGLSRRATTAVLRAEFARGSSTEIPVGDGVAWIDVESAEIDYFTLYGSLIDGHFPCEVRGAAVLDIGAHKGYFALRCLMSGARRVDSYEPASQNFTRLQQSATSFEGRGEWRVHKSAVGAQAGSVELHLSSGSWGHSVHVPVGGISVGSETVEKIALSSALHSVGEDGGPVVVKINVEGAAGEMILGTTPTDWVNVTTLWVDVEDNDPLGLAPITDHLRASGLTHVRSENHRNLFVRT